MKKIVSILLLIVLIIAAAVPAAASKYTTVAPIVLDGLEWNMEAVDAVLALRAAGYVPEDYVIRRPEITDPKGIYHKRPRFTPKRASWIINDPTLRHSKFPYTMNTFDEDRGYTFIQDHVNRPKEDDGLLVYTIPGEDMIKDIFGYKVDALHICFTSATPQTHLVEIDIKLVIDDEFSEHDLRAKLGDIYGVQDCKYTDGFDDFVWIWKGKEKTALFMDVNDIVFVSLPGLINPDSIEPQKVEEVELVKTNEVREIVYVYISDYRCSENQD